MISTGGGLVLAASLLIATAACRGPCTPSPPCQTPEAPIANAESVEAEAGGVRWYAAVDTAGSTLVEPPAAPFVLGGANGSERAARISGAYAPKAPGFAVLGLQLDRRVMDAIAPRAVGLSFWTKIGGASGPLRVTAICSDGDSFGMEIRRVDALKEWVNVSIPYKVLKPSPKNHSSTLDATRIERIEWRLLGSDERYELLIDDVTALYCLPRDVHPSCSAK
jgi:hypothetical protein